jgi:predicted PurR-regulated permease PerM
MKQRRKKPANIFQNLKGYRPFMLILLIFSLYLAYLILRPFLHTIILSVILATMFHPLKAPLLRLYKGRENVVALTAVVVIIFVIVLPILLFTSALVSQGVESVNQINQWINEGNVQKLLEDPRIISVRNWIRENLRIIQIDESEIPAHLLQLSKTFGQYILARGAVLIKDFASMVFHFSVMMFITFYIVRDGEEMLKGIKHLSPLREEQENRIVDKVRAVARSALLGGFLTAIIQGTVGGIGLAIVGIPPIFWGTLMGFASFIPVIGTALIWVPAVVYLLLMGKLNAAIFLSLWCIILVGTIDNFLRPFLMRGEGKMSTFYIFLAIIGGIQCFGLLGILYGPLILGFANIMLYTYQVEYRELLDES